MTVSKTAGTLEAPSLVPVVMGIDWHIMVPAVSILTSACLDKTVVMIAVKSVETLLVRLPVTAYLDSSKHPLGYAVSGHRNNK